ncbi:hypothetical protein M0805_008466 [Coniferiporia weirii]|nr:hypothetical protein M0805_008466 [Coniferiporia weirii]
MDEDEDLRRAIALSLEEAKNPPPRRQETPGSEDDDAEAQFQRDLQAAIAESKAIEARERGTNGAVVTPGASSAPSFLSERAQMEKARLERQKRMRGGDTEESGVSTGPPPAKRQRNSTPSTSSLLQTAKASAAALERTHARVSDPGSSGSATIALYWEGELRQIANRLVNKEKDTRPTFRLSEIIGAKSDISFAILSSYSNMVPWLYEFFDQRTPIVIINQPGDGNAGLTELAPNMLMTKPFLRGGRGCMHIKLMLIFYKDGRLRVAVPTANFVDYDWRDIENTVWLQDVKLRETPIRHDPKATDFPGTLQRVLHALNVPAALTKLTDGDFPNLPIEAISELRMRWDWSKVQVKLVASLAGKHEGWDQVERTGHPALMKAIQDLGARTPKNKELVLECQGSSIGTYSTQWMNEFYCSARGESAKTWLDKPKNQRAKLPWPSVKILFPSVQTVKDSVLGIPGGGTMFCRKTQWEAKNFPRELFYDSNSKRGGVLMHSKMIVGTFKDRGSVAGGSGSTRAHLPDSEDEDDGEGPGENEGLVGWAYVGSHNFTPSAWGTLSGSTAKPALNIVNFELGIVLPLRNDDEADRIACWKRPPRKYVSGVDRAWMQDEMREGGGSRS